MIDHMSLAVRDIARSRSFYSQALAPLGGGVQMEFEGACGIGEPGKPSFWLHEGEQPASAMHFAFMAKQRPAVDAFYEAALAAGGKDNGPPGVRQDYHPNYYAAFVIDPDGHNIEAVCHAPPGAGAKRGAAKRAAARAATKPAARKSGRGITRSARKPSRKGARKASRR